MMSGKEEHRIVQFPTDDEMKIAFDAYCLAVGKVVHSWNNLHEKLADLFARIKGGDADAALAEWHAMYSDLGQKQMLKDVLFEATPESLGNNGAVRKADLIEVLDWIIEFGEDRNNAVHAPAMLGTYADGTRMIAHVWSNHRRAKKLKGKVLLNEFAWCEQWAETLARYSTQAYSSLVAVDYPWPEKPVKLAKPTS